MRRSLVGLAVIVAIAGTALGFAADDKKYTVKEVMKGAHGGGANSLLNKVKNGSASDTDKAKLVELYSSMPEGKPKKGEAGDFKKLGETMLSAAKAAKAGDTGWKDKLNKATNCKMCHDAHK